MADPKEPAGDGHNSKAREAGLLAIMAEMRPGLDAVEAAEALLKKARNDFAVVRNKAERAGWTLKILDKALKQERQPTARREHQGQADEEYFVMKTLGLPVAAVQGEFNFETEEARDEAYWSDQGYQAGIRGDAPKPPDVVPPHLHQLWLKRRADGEAYSAWGKSEAGAVVDRRVEGEPAGGTVTTIDEARARKDGEPESAGADDDKTAAGRPKGAARKDPLLQ